MSGANSQRAEIGSVHVRRVPGGTHFACRLDPQGWRCGQCMRGNLGPYPKLRHRCRVCKSFVSIVSKVGDRPWLDIEKIMEEMPRW